MEDAAEGSGGGCVTRSSVFDVKYLATSLLFLLSAEALAFDSSAWLKRRQQFTLEAERLRAAYSNVVARVTDPAEDLFIPVEEHADGSVKTGLSAKRAQILIDEGLVWAQGVVLRQCDEQGRETLRIESEGLIFDRKAKRGWSEGPAKVTRGKTSFSGENVFFASDEEYVLSLKSSCFDSKDLKMGGAL